MSFWLLIFSEAKRGKNHRDTEVTEGREREVGSERVGVQYQQIHRTSSPLMLSPVEVCAEATELRSNRSSTSSLHANLR